MVTASLWLTGLAALGLPAGAGPAETPPPPAAATFRDSLDVNLVEVDVFVTDRRGEPVPGLTAEDFEVYEDDRRVEITHFAAVHEPRALPSVRAGPAAVTPEPAPSGGPVPSDPLRLAVLIDDFNLRPQNRARVLAPLAEFLSTRLEPADEVLLATFDQSVRVHQPFSRDRERLAAALERVAELPASGWLAEAEARDGMLTAEGWLGDDDTACDQYIETYIRQVVLPAKWRTELTVQAVEDLVASLGELPGRKALLYVTEGLQLRPGGSGGLAVNSICGDRALGLRLEGFDTALALKRLTAVANAARVTLYPMGVTGVGDPHRGGPGGLIAAQDRQSGLEALSFLAHDTGGEALLNVYDVASALRPVLEDAGSRYVLGYASPRRDRGEVHLLRVKVKRRGVEVRHRRSYRDRTPEERILQRLLAALWVGGGENPLGLRLEPLAEPTLDGEGYRVPLRLGIPIEQLALKAGEGEHAGKVKVFVTVRGEGGLRTPVEVAEVAIHVRGDDLAAAREKLYGYDIHLTLGRGDHRVAVAVVDEGSALASFLTHDLEAGTP